MNSAVEHSRRFQRTSDVILRKLNSRVQNFLQYCSPTVSCTEYPFSRRLSSVGSSKGHHLLEDNWRYLKTIFKISLLAETPNIFHLAKTSKLWKILTYPDSRKLPILMDNVLDSLSCPESSRPSPKNYTKASNRFVQSENSFQKEQNSITKWI